MNRVAWILLALMAGGWFWTYQTGETEAAELRAKIAGKDAAISKLQSDAAKAALEAQNDLMVERSKLDTQKAEADDALRKEQDRNQRFAVALARANADAGELRNAIGAFAAPGGGEADRDTAAACRERATTLGQQLAASVQLQEVLAGRAESCAATARYLLGAWPRAKMTTP